MDLAQILLLILGGFAAGIVNSIAGGGALISYPLMLLFGVPPVAANMSSSIAVWPGGVASAFGYRKHLRKIPKRYWMLLIPCLVGGLIGAVILGHTSNDSFQRIAPWLIAFAVILMILRDPIHKWLKGREGKKIIMHHKIVLWGIWIFVFLLSVYGGFFGAGFGIIMLAFLGLTELTDIREMNGLKNLAAISANLTANLYFITTGMVHWHETLWMIVGTATGGYIGAIYASRWDGALVRRSAIAIGIVVAAVLFYKL